MRRERLASSSSARSKRSRREDEDVELANGSRRDGVHAEAAVGHERPKDERDRGQAVVAPDVEEELELLRGELLAVAAIAARGRPPPSSAGPHWWRLPQIVAVEAEHPARRPAGDAAAGAPARAHLVHRRRLGKPALDVELRMYESNVALIACLHRPGARRGAC
jgi:hypothetical protein